jgi:SAM-dependent methyltransferase
MNTEHIQYLKCPHCSGEKGNLKLGSGVSADEFQRVKEGILDCGGGHRYYIRDFIPDFVSDEDQTVQNSHIYDTLWDLHDVQSYQGRTDEYISKFQKSARMPGDLKNYFENKVILDAGCGEGRFTYLSSSLGSKAVISVDYSATALRRALKQTGHPLNVTFVRGNLEFPPVQPKIDYAFSMGVLHHTPSTKRSFDQVVTTVVPGGYFSLYVYKKWSLPWIYWLIRPLTLRLSKESMNRLCEFFGWGYHPKTEPVIPLGKWFKKMGKLDIFGFARITYEGLTTPFLWEHRKSEVEGWLRDAGFELISSTNEVAASGRKKEVK